jgi:hypothetical protein
MKGSNFKMKLVPAAMNIDAPREAEFVKNPLTP